MRRHVLAIVLATTILTPLTATTALASEVSPGLQAAMLNSADIPSYTNDMGAGVMQTACATYRKGYSEPVSSRAATNTVVSGFSSDFLGNGNWQSTVGSYRSPSAAKQAYTDLQTRAKALCTYSRNMNVGDDGDLVMATVSSRYVALPALSGLPRFAVASSTIIWDLDGAMNAHPTMGYQGVNGSSYTVFTVDGSRMTSVEVSSTRTLDNSERALAQRLAPTVAERVRNS